MLWGEQRFATPHTVESQVAQAEGFTQFLSFTVAAAAIPHLLPAQSQGQRQR